LSTLESYWPHGDAVRRLVTGLFSEFHASTLADVGVHVGELLSVPATNSQGELGQLVGVAPAASATSHAVTLTHAMQKSTSSGGPEGGPEDPEIIWSQLLL
jgi:hypothetical protein